MPIECLAYNHVQSNTQTKTNFWSNQPNSLIVIHTPTHNLYIIIHSMQYCVIYPLHVIDGRSVWCPQRPWIDAALPCIAVQQDVVFFLEGASWFSGCIKLHESCNKIITTVASQGITTFRIESQNSTVLALLFNFLPLEASIVQQ